EDEASMWPQRCGCGKRPPLRAPSAQGYCFNVAAALWLRKGTSAFTTLKHEQWLQCGRSAVAAERGSDHRRGSDRSCFTVAAALWLRKVPIVAADVKMRFCFNVAAALWLRKGRQ